MKHCTALLLILVLICPVLADTWIANCSSSSANNEGAEIRVNTVPDGALVAIDNAILGSTPYQEDITRRGVSYGAHTLTLTKAGYTTASLRFELCSGFLTDVRTDLVPVTPAPATKTTAVPSLTGPGGGHTPGVPADAGLMPEPAAAALPETTGSLAVTTNPQGAEVYVDGSLKGISPVTLEQLTPGIHALDLKLQGYQDNTARIAITAGERQTYTAALEPDTGNPAGSQAVQYTPGFGPFAAIMAACCILVLSRWSR